MLRLDPASTPVADRESESRAALATASLLVRRSLGEPCGQDCVDWAVALLEAGRDGPQLYQLAGMIAPHNHFELQALCDRVLLEQSIDRKPLVEAASDYARLLLANAIGTDDKLIAAVDELANVYIASMSTPNLLDELLPFYLLNYARLDLESYDHQWYVPNVDRSNFVHAMREEAERFIRP